MEFPNLITVRALFVTLVTALFAAALYSTASAVSALAGGLVAIANFRLMARFLKRAIIPGVNPARGTVMGVASFIVRYGLLAVVLMVIIRSVASPVFFIAGLSSVVAAIFLSTRDLYRITQ